MHISITKIIIHKDIRQDTVFIFTPIRYPNGIDYLNLTIQVPSGLGEQWVIEQFNTTTYEVVSGSMEVCAP